MTKPRSLPRSSRASQAAGLAACGLIAVSAVPNARGDAALVHGPSGCVDALEAATPLRRVGAARDELVVDGQPLVLRLERGDGACVAVVAEARLPIELRIAIHASDGEVLAESTVGPTAAALACAHPHESRYAVVRTAETARVTLTRLAGSGLGLSPPPGCASRSPTSGRGEVDPGGPPGADDPVPVSASRDQPPRSGLVERETHRVQSIGGVAVPIPIEAHAGRVLAVEAGSGTTASIVLVDASGRILASDATSSGTARVFYRSTSDAPLRAFVRGASPATVRVFEAPP